MTSDGKLLWSLGDTAIPKETRERIADELCARDDFDVDATIRQLGVWWHGDNPMECRLAWEALERAKERAL